jgi:hypothetical protein
VCILLHDLVQNCLQGGGGGGGEKYFQNVSGIRANNRSGVLFALKLPREIEAVWCSSWDWYKIAARNRSGVLFEFRDWYKIAHSNAKGAGNFFQKFC